MSISFQNNSGGGITPSISLPLFPSILPTTLPVHLNDITSNNNSSMSPAYSDACNFRVFSVFVLTLTLVVVITCIIALYSSRRKKHCCPSNSSRKADEILQDDNDGSDVDHVDSGDKNGESTLSAKLPYNSLSRDEEFHDELQSIVSRDDGYDHSIETSYEELDKTYPHNHNIKDDDDEDDDSNNKKSESDDESYDENDSENGDNTIKVDQV